MTSSKPGGHSVGYVRVSTSDQNPARQHDAFGLKDIELDKIFEDYASGRTDKRPGWAECERYLREGDTLYIYSIDRLSRSLVHFFKMVEGLNTKGVTVVVVNSDTTLPPIGDRGKLSAIEKLRLSISAAVAEFEVSTSAEIRAEGIAIAKARGKYKGRLSPLRGATLEAFKTALGEPNVVMAELARRFGVTAATVYNWKKRLKKENPGHEVTFKVHQMK